MSDDDTRSPGPGDRQPKETAKAFEAFRCYLEMGPGRSLAKVGEALGKSKTLMDRWSSRWNWAERVREYEGEAVAAADDGLRDVIKERTRRQAEIAQLHQEALALPSREVLRRLRDDEDLLRKLPLNTLISLSASAARAHARVVHVERLALGISTDNVNVNDDRTQAEERAKRMDDDELDAALLGVDELAQRRKDKKKAAGK